MTRCKCLICGKVTKTDGCENEEKFKENPEWIFWCWKDECARTICQVLFGYEAHPLLKSFKSSQYCSSCQQIVRDVNFTYRQLQSFQKTLDKLTRIVRKRVNINYSNVKKKCEKTNNNLLTNIPDDVVDIEVPLKDNYSHEELTKIICIFASKFITKASSTGKEISEEEMQDDAFCAIGNSNEFFNAVKLEAIKTENEDCLWDLDAHSGSENDPDWQSDEKMLTNSSNKRKGEIEDENELDAFPRLKKQSPKIKGSKKKLERMATKKRHRIGEAVKKRGRPRKYDIDYSKPKGNVSCTHEDCSEKFSSEEKMKIHVRGFHEGVEKPYECSHSLCSASFAKWKELVNHVKDVHDNRKKKPHSCKFCGKGYENETDLNTHLEAHSNHPNPFTCAFCPEFYSNSVHLRMHVKKVHPDPEDLMKPYCKICDKYFSNQNNYSMHHRHLHRNPELFGSEIPTCHDCNRQFSSQGALRKHKKRHDQEKKVICETCGKRFSYIGFLTEHKKIHDQSMKKYSCKICGKSFVSSEHCRRHEVIHTGLREFICQFCGKSFNRKGNLTAHIKLHATQGEGETMSSVGYNTQYNNIHITN